MAGLIGIFIDYSTSSVFSHLAAKANGLRKAINTVLYLRLFLFITIFIFSVFISFLDFDFPLLSLFFTLGVFNLGFLYEYKRQNVKFALITLVEKALFAILVYLISMVSIDVLYLCLCYLAASISSLVLQYLEYREDVFNIGIPRTRPILQFMGNYVQFYIITITQLSYGITSRLIFESRMGLEAFVYFSLAMQVIALASILQSQVDRVFRPEIIQNIQAGDRDALFLR